MAKSLLITYVLWVFGGLFGLHHVYLRRDSHALLWMVTFGGFGVGWLREFWRLPKYVENSNKPSRNRQKSQQPLMNMSRVFGQIAVGIYFGVVALIGLSSLSSFYILALPLSVTLGVHLVANVGEETSDVGKTMLASIITSPIFYGRPIATIPISIVATITSAQCRQYKVSSHMEENLSVRLYRLGLACLAFTMPISYCVFYNTTVTVTYIADTIGLILDSLRIFPSISGFLESALLLPYHMWKLLTGGIHLSYEYNQEWARIFDSVATIQAERKKLAYEVLGLQDKATREDINKSYREMVKRWHPDHNPHNLNEAQQQFLEIQAAYEVLTKPKNEETL
ncbi:dnaJ homolog subfamily C member 22 [Callorhinchus milii]|uniref:DnaJ homolog subfamily C member 22 n=1 Tax=Callorhinchus milii TaxID=7868 RepID=V9KV19_CALMI|nr:dnaJ homolog subfamily C member 22 [Callorhinchus milii]|eukprot:gi/632982520/ref/XP_007908181.1/ PREDICTED: dnaJ homolog subfamily C member 22 [Callorhinchus milii]